MSEKLRITGGDFTVDSQTNVGPSPNPVAVVQVGVSNVTITNLCLVVTAARTDRTCPAGVAFRFSADMAAFEEFLLRGMVNARGDVSQFMTIGIHKPVTRSNIT